MRAWLDRMWVGPIGTVVRTFFVVVVSELLLLGVGVFDITDGQWKALASAGIAGVLKVVLNWFDRSYTRYGKTDEL